MNTLKAIGSVVRVIVGRHLNADQFNNTGFSVVEGKVVAHHSSMIAVAFNKGILLNVREYPNESGEEFFHATTVQGWAERQDYIENRLEMKFNPDDYADQRVITHGIKTAEGIHRVMKFLATEERQTRLLSMSKIIDVKVGSDSWVVMGNVGDCRGAALVPCTVLEHQITRYSNSLAVATASGLGYFVSQIADGVLYCTSSFNWGDRWAKNIEGKLLSMVNTDASEWEYLDGGWTGITDQLHLNCLIASVSEA